MAGQSDKWLVWPRERLLLQYTCSVRIPLWIVGLAG
jgi:hypothetical protein